MFGRSRDAVSTPEGLRVCVASGAQARCTGAEGTTLRESREPAQGERETWLLWLPHRDLSRGRTVQLDLLLGLSPAPVKIILVFSLIAKIPRSGLELACCYSFSALPSATSV